MNNALLLWLLLSEDEEDSKTITLVNSAWVNAKWTTPQKSNSYYVIRGLPLGEIKKIKLTGLISYNRGEIYFVYPGSLESFTKYVEESGYNVKIRDYDNEDWR